MLLIFFSAFSYNNEPTIITIVSSKNIKKASELIVDFEGEIVTDTWNKDEYVRIEMEIKVEEIGIESIRYIKSELRRYLVKKMKVNDESVMLSMPNLKDSIIINGRILKEEIYYRLLVPKNVTVKKLAEGE